MSKIKQRFKEPTTYIGLGLLAQAIMLFTKSDPVHIEAVGQVTEQVAQPLSTGDYVGAGTILFGALAGIFMSEKASTHQK